MSSAEQIAANRKNAQKSKGPRTAAGKARASCNSRKHAAPRIESIARAICPETANAGLWEQALIIGKCATVLGCVQAERIALIEQLLGGTTAQSRTGSVAVQARPLRDELEALGPRRTGP